MDSNSNHLPTTSIETVTTAVAHPNIALIKYWGKQDKPGNIPASPSLSITLDTMATETSLTESEQDEFYLNDDKLDDAKVERFLSALRTRFDVPYLKISSRNNFPTGAGLASSASGFAALMTAINRHCDLGLTAELQSNWARMGSASAARSFFGGYVSLVPPDWRAQPIASAKDWPLSIVVAVTTTAAKATSSTKGMELSRTTSPFYTRWVQGSSEDYAEANDAIADRDFEKLAHVAEHSCLKMHAVMLTSSPTLQYWNPTTLRLMDEVRALRSQGLAVFFTIDAGPQLKAICLPEHSGTVVQALDQIEGVQQTIVCGLGPGAYLR